MFWACCEGGGYDRTRWCIVGDSERNLVSGRILYEGILIIIKRD